jgi:hypothetical protein
MKRSTRKRRSRPRANRPAHKGGKTMATANQQGTSALQLVLAWGFVGIPLALGVLQTLINAMKLFQ